MFRSVTVTTALLCTLFASAALADDDEVGRYQLAPVKGGFVRLDTVTGQISHCRQKIVGWICDEARDGARSQSRMKHRDKDSRDKDSRDKKERMSRAPENWDGDITGHPPRGIRETRRLRREVERLRKENEELRAMIEGDPHALPPDRRDGPPMRFRDVPPDHPEIPPDHPEMDEDGDDQEPHSRAPRPPEQDDEVGALPEGETAPLPDRKPCADGKTNCSSDKAHNESADEALVERMMEKFRDLMRDMQKPKPQSL